MDAVLGGSNAYVKPTPVFSFHSIVDEDVSLISYIIMNYYDTSIFDFSEVLDMDFGKVISIIYFRTVSNPLRLFTKEGVDESFVDECYEEFLRDKEAEILENGITTEVPNLIRLFKDSAGISPSIFYYNDIQLQALETIDLLKDVEKIHYNDVSNRKHSQIYIRDYTEAGKFAHITDKTFYMCSSKRNIDALEDIKQSPEILQIAMARNQISIYDLYNRDIVNNVEGE